MSTNNRTRTVKINPRSLLQDCFAGSQASTTYSARNESSFSSQPVNLRGSATISRGSPFNTPSIVTTGTVLPLFKHQTLQNVGSASEYCLATSQVFWFNSNDLALRGFSTYAAGFNYRPIPQSPDFAVGDWVSTDNSSVLALPNTAITATFTTTSTLWVSPTVSMTPRRKVPSGTQFWGDPYNMGSAFSVPNWSFALQARVETVPQTDMVRYLWNGIISVFGVPHNDPVEIWVSTNSRRVQIIKTTTDFVLVNPTQPYAFRLEPTRFTRTGETNS